MIRLAKIKIDLIKFLRIKNEQILVSKVHWYQIRIWFSLCLKRTKFTWIIGLLLISDHESFVYLFVFPFG